MRVELVTITTTGDRIQDRPLHEAGGKGLFTKEVELALIAGEADLAVHSFKDVPVTMPLVAEAKRLLTIMAVPEREDVRDALVTPDGRGLAELAEGAMIGTTSLRRRVLLLEQRPDLRIVDLRGNVDTRLGRLNAGEFDAIVLACAGLKRLGRLAGLPHVPLDPTIFIPAAGQGALAVQCRAEDADIQAVIAPLDDPVARACVDAEREVVRRLNGDCTSPIGAWAEQSNAGLHLRAGWHDGQTLHRAEATGTKAAQTVVRQLVQSAAH